MLVFLVIGGIGFFMLVVTWFIGEIFDLGHDVAGWFGDHLGDVGVDGHHIEIGHHAEAADAGPSPFSSRVIFAFMTAFGGGGAIASLYHLPVPICVLTGLGAGLAIGGATYGVAHLVFQQQASSGFELSALVGRTGRVAVTIPPNGTGQVTVSAAGGSSTLLARSRGSTSIPEGAVVRVAEVQGDLLWVEAQVASNPSSGGASG